MSYVAEGPETGPVAMCLEGLTGKVFRFSRVVIQGQNNLISRVVIQGPHIYSSVDVFEVHSLVVSGHSGLAA